MNWNRQIISEGYIGVTFGWYRKLTDHVLTEQFTYFCR